MLIDHTRPKNVKYEGGQGVYAANTHTHGGKAKVPRVPRSIAGSQASGSESHASSAALPLQ